MISSGSHPCLRALMDALHHSLDEMYLRIAGRMVYLWRAVDSEGEVLDVLVQSKRNFKSARQAQRFLSVHDQAANLFHVPYPESATAAVRRALRQRTFAVWREISKTAAAA